MAEGDEWSLGSTSLKTRTFGTKGIAFGDESDVWSLEDGTFRAVASEVPRRTQRPSSGASVRVKREYVRRSDLYTSNLVILPRNWL